MDKLNQDCIQSPPRPGYKQKSPVRQNSDQEHESTAPNPFAECTATTTNLENPMRALATKKSYPSCIDSGATATMGPDISVQNEHRANVYGFAGEEGETMVTTGEGP